ncbi:hypothetical protein ACFLWA_08915, partial [Chloroflexota bacterium]
VAEVQEDGEALPSSDLVEDLEAILAGEPEPESEPELAPVLADDIDDSLGWVVVEPEEDYYSGWDDIKEERPKPVEEWVREDPEEILQAREARKAQSKKKSGKGFGRGRRR